MRNNKPKSYFACALLAASFACAACSTFKPVSNDGGSQSSSAGGGGAGGTGAGPSVGVGGDSGPTGGGGIGGAPSTEEKADLKQFDSGASKLSSDTYQLRVQVGHWFSRRAMNSDGYRIRGASVVSQ